MFIINNPPLLPVHLLPRYRVLPSVCNKGTPYAVRKVAKVLGTDYKSLAEGAKGQTRGRCNSPRNLLMLNPDWWGLGDGSCTPNAGYITLSPINENKWYRRVINASLGRIPSGYACKSSFKDQVQHTQLEGNFRRQSDRAILSDTGAKIVPSDGICWCLV